jgi:hypothetical protein
VAGSDFTAGSGQVVWADGDTANKTIAINIIDDTALESDEQFSVKLTAVTGNLVGNASSYTLTIKDNEVNRAPAIVGLENKDVNAGETVTLTAQVTDLDGDSMTYQWSQLSGNAVVLQNATTPIVSFVAPNVDGALQLQLVARDSRSASSTTTITLTVKGAVAPTPAPTPTPVSAEKSGGSWHWLWLTLLLPSIWLRRQAQR